MTHVELSYEALKFKSKLKKNQKVKPSNKAIGQEMALQALSFGLNLNAPNSHIFCMGPKGVGRTTLTLKTVRDFAKTQKAPKDWVYVANFARFAEPVALCFEAGQGRQFTQLMAQQVENLKTTLRETFNGEKYQGQIKAIDQDFLIQKERYFNNLNQSFLKENIALVQTKEGWGLSPVYQKKVLNADEFNELPLKVRQKMVPRLEKAQKKLAQALQKMPFTEEQKQRQKEALNLSLAQKVIENCFAPIVEIYDSVEGLKDYLLQAKNFLLSHFPLLFHSGAEKIYKHLQVNPFVCHGEKDTAPVVHLSVLSLSALLGCIQKTSRVAESFSPHLLLQSGALHQANGGYLILDANELLRQREVWTTLKQALFTHQIVMESPLDGQSLYPPRAVLPATIPLSVKVILVGARSVFEELKSKEEDFEELFKVQAEFIEQMPRSFLTEKAYVAELAEFVQQNHLLPVLDSAYEILLKYAVSLSGTEQKMTLHLPWIHDLIRGADFIARQNKKAKIDADLILQALNQKEERENYPQKEWLNAVKNQWIHLTVKGTKVGALNTLSVCLNKKKFGRVACLSAVTYAGNGVITDVEHQSNFGGSVHTKGLLILSAYLSSRFGQVEPMKLNASLTFEQSYTPIDGDSASAAELCALMSSIAGIPLTQEIALTGSVNQRGEIQAVGGLNEKITGFFDVCQTLGMTKKQGVIIPKVCQDGLILPERVLQAIQKKIFHIYPVSTIDECMEILSGLNKKAVDDKITTAWHKAYLNSKK